MIVRPATAQEGERIDELFAICFEFPLDRKQSHQEDPRIHSWGAYDEDGAMMSTFSVTDFDIQFDGHCCRMGGIGGVATLPQYRRRGGIRGCFNAALPDMYEKGYDFSYLYPFSTVYYRKFGYESCVPKLNAVIDLDLLKVPNVGGTFRLAEQSRPMTAEIRTIDENWESRFNMMVIHGDEFYQWPEKQDPAASGVFTYVYFNEAGLPKSYTTFRLENQPDGRNLQCKHFFFVDKQGYHGLMSLFKSLAADHRYVKFQLPANQAMQYLCPEWSFGAAQWSVERGGMVRVVNVGKVLEKARYIGSGSVTLEVRDPQIEQNNRKFHVIFREGKALSVEPTEAEADAALEISAFSTLIAGSMDFADAQEWLDGIAVKNPAACLDRVFYRKNLMIVDYF